MNCVIEAMALRSRLKTGMLIMSAVEESSRKRGEERRGASKEGILNCRSKNTVYYFSYVTCYIFGYSHWRSRSLQKESIQSTEDIDPIHPNPLQRPSNPITSLVSIVKLKPFSRLEQVILRGPLMALIWHVEAWKAD